MKHFTISAKGKRTHTFKESGFMYILETMNDEGRIEEYFIYADNRKAACEKGKVIVSAQDIKAEVKRQNGLQQLHRAELLRETGEYTDEQINEFVERIKAHYDIVEAEKQEENKETTKETNTYTTYNRSFSSYEEAQNYCNESDVDPSYITTEQPTKASKNALQLNLQLFGETLELNYVLDQSVFASESEYFEVKNKYKSNDLTLDQIMNDVNNKIIDFYKSIYTHFHGYSLPSDTILYKESVYSFIEQNYNTPQYWTFFSILKANNYIGVCLRGFTLDYRPMEAQMEKRLTSVYQNGFNSNMPHNLYNLTFLNYQEAYEYAIKNDITLSMIHPIDSPITNEYLVYLENKYLKSKHDLNCTEISDFLSHLNTVPYNIYVEKRINDCKYLLQRLDTLRENKRKQEEEFTKTVKNLETILDDLYSKGVTKREIGNMVQYLKNGTPIYSWFSGESVTKIYNDIKVIHENY